MRRLALIAAAAAALAAPSAAFGGGMAAFALHGPSAQIKAGEVWLAQLRVVSCMGTLTDVTPSLTITNSAGETVAFRGRRSGRAGIYTARVVFPSAGEWSYQVTAAGMPTEAHGPFRVAPSAKPSRLLAALPPVGAVLLVLGTGLALRRRRH
jgi:uncharacterized protein (DUF2141 family)